MTDYDWKRIAGDRGLKIDEQRGAINWQKETIKSRDAEIDRLNRIMPHIGETCKWNFASTKCKADKHILCDAPCINGEWELKE